MAETQTYVEIFNAIASTPHGDYDVMSRVHKTAMERAPIFYAHLGAWYKTNGVVRDHNVLFAATMCLSNYSAIRDVGLALARDLDPRNLLRVVKLVGGAQDGQRFSSIPRSLRTEVKRYLEEREMNESWFDKAVVSNRAAMHDLYVAAHIAPHYYAQAILFDDTPPEGSTPWKIKQIANMTDDFEKASAAIQAELPYPILVSLLGNKLPTALVALVNSMTPAQVMNNLKSLKAAGVMENEDLRKMVHDKIKAAGSDKRVSAGKAAEMLSSNVADLDEETATLVAKSATSRVQSGPVIKKNTAIMVDKSGSMHVADAVARQLFAMLATAMSPDAHLYAYAFDDAAYELTTDFNRIDRFNEDLEMVKAGGMTSYGIPLLTMVHKGQTDVEQLIFIGDEGENTTPTFSNTYGKLPLTPNVVMIRVGQHSNQIESACKALGVEFRAIEFSGDKYSVQNVIPLLSGSSIGELVMGILDYPLPVRKDS